MTELLFDAPWWLPTVLGVVGIALFWNGNRTQDTTLRNVGMGVVLLAVAVVTISVLVDTPVERAVKRSKQLARSVEQSDWTTLRSLLDPHASLSVAGGLQIYSSRDEIVTGAQRAVDRFGVKNVRFLQSRAQRDGAIITVSLAVLSDHDATAGRTIPTNWQMEWQQSGKNWSLVRITNLKVGTATGNAASAQFPRP